MNLKRLVTMSILAVLSFYGCSDEKSINTCGNDKLDDNEACDGNKFRSNLRRCPGSEEVSELVVCTASCTLDTTACPVVEEDPCKDFTPSCDENNGWLKACKVEGNEAQIERKQCVNGSQTCDPQNGCVSNGNVSDPCDGFVASCEDNVWHTCSNKTKSDITCEGETPKCDPIQGCIAATVNPEHFKCEDDKVVYCDAQNNCKVEKDCTTNHGTCAEESDGEITIAECVYAATCNNNVITLCSDSSCESANCGEFNEVCSVEKGNCVAPDTISCKDDHTVVLNGTIEYDCNNNENDHVICNPEIGCTDAVCKGDTLYVYLRTDDGIESATEECDPGTCSNKLQMCTKCEFTDAQCRGNIEMKCVDGKIVDRDCGVLTCDEEQGGCYNANPCNEAGGDWLKCSDDNKSIYMCESDVWQVYEECGQSLYCDDEALTNEYCSYVSSCGNGYVDGDEQCDPGGIDGAPAAEIMRYCSSWNENDNDFVYLGKPGCQDSTQKNPCKFDSTKCIKSKDVETVAESWPVTENSDFGGKYKNIIKLVHPNGSYKVSEASSSYWNIGYWSKATTPQFDTHYIQITPATVTALNTLTTASIRMTLSKNGTAGPKNVRLAFYSGDSKMEESRTVTITTEPVEYIFPIRTPSKYKTSFSFRISGYNAGSDNGGTLRIKDMALYTYSE